MIAFSYILWSFLSTMVLGVKMPDNFSYSLRHLRKMKLFWVRYQVNIEYSNLVEIFLKIRENMRFNWYEWFDDQSFYGERGKICLRKIICDRVSVQLASFMTLRFLELKLFMTAFYLDNKKLLLFYMLLTEFCPFSS